MVGARARIQLGGMAHAESEFRMMSFNYSDVTIRFLDFSIGAGITPWKGATFGIGYHFIEFYGEDDRDSDESGQVDLTIEGAYLSAGWEF